MRMPMQVSSFVLTTIPTLCRDTNAEPNHNKGLTARENANHNKGLTTQENEHQDHHNIAWLPQGIS